MKDNPNRVLRYHERKKRSNGGAFGKGGPKQHPAFAEMPQNSQKVLRCVLSEMARKISREMGDLDEETVLKSLISLMDRGFITLVTDPTYGRWNIRFEPQPGWRVKTLGIMHKTGDWHLALEEYQRGVPEQHTVRLIDPTGKSMVVDRRDLSLVEPEYEKWLQQPS